MNMMGINGYNNGWSNYSIPTIKEINQKDLENASLANAEPEKIQIHEGTSPIENINRVERKNAPLEDISLTFNKQDDFGTIGRDSDIHSLDIENAIADAKKDEVLKQYQFFVGSAKNVFKDISGDEVFKQF